MLRSFEKDFKEKLPGMKSWFLKGRQPEQTIDCKMKKVKFRENKKIRKINKKEEGPFAVAYNAKLKSLSKIIKDNLYFY